MRHDEVVETIDELALLSFVVLVGLGKQDRRESLLCNLLFGIVDIESWIPPFVENGRGLRSRHICEDGWG